MAMLNNQRVHVNFRVKQHIKQRRPCSLTTNDSKRQNRLSRGVDPGTALR